MDLNLRLTSPIEKKVDLLAMAVCAGMVYLSCALLGITLGNNWVLLFGTIILGLCIFLMVKFNKVIIPDESAIKIANTSEPKEINPELIENAVKEYMIKEKARKKAEEEERKAKELEEELEE